MILGFERYNPFQIHLHATSPFSKMLLSTKVGQVTIFKNEQKHFQTVSATVFSRGFGGGSSEDLI